jgi:hypothetical protein
MKTSQLSLSKLAWDKLTQSPNSGAQLDLYQYLLTE